MEKKYNYYNKKNNEKNNKKKFNFTEKKDNAIKSISEVEYFLRNFKSLSKYIKLYKILK